MHRAHKKEEVHKDSVFLLDSSYSIRVKRVHGSFVFSLLLQFGLLVASVLVAMYCIITSIGIEVNSARLISGTFLICLFVFLVMHLGDFAKTVLPEMLFLIVLVLSEHNTTLIHGACHLANRVIQAINEYYDLKLAIYRVSEVDETESLTLLFLLAAFLLSWLFANQVYQKGVNYVYLTISLLVIIAPYLVGKRANTLVFFAQVILIIGMFGLTSIQRFDNRYQDPSKKRQFAVTASMICVTYMMIAVMLLFLTSIFLNQETYSRLPVKRWKKQLIHTVETTDFDSIQSITKLKIPNVNTSVGGLDGGKLNINNGVIHFNHSTQLKVTMVRPDSGIFLKGFTGANYTGSAWEPVSKAQSQGYEEILGKFQKAEYVSDNFSNLGLSYLAATTDFVQVMPSDIMIEYVKANKNFLYYPYYTWFFINGGYQSSYQYQNLNYSEAYINPQSKYDSYTLRYLSSILPSLDKLEGVPKMEASDFAEIIRGFDDVVYEEAYSFPILAEYEKQYRDYVYDVYLTVPENGLYQLKEEFRTSKKVLDMDYLSLSSQEKTEKICEFVKDYLWKHAAYSLKPGKTPNDEDYIEYFLYTNHKGYCAHYASAATIMLRLLGVPARYVEGYYIKEDMIDKGTIVINENAMLQGGDFSPNYIVGEANVYTKGIRNAQVRPMVEVDVDDSAAHAWVEVYVDGFGWYPLEFTEAETEEDTVAQVKEPSVTPVVDMSEDEDLLAEEAKPEKEDVPYNKEQEDSVSSNLSEQEPTSRQEPKRISFQQILKFLLWCIIVVVVGTAILRYPRYRLNVWRKYLRRCNTSEIYVHWYELVEKLRNSKQQVEEYHTKLSKEQWEQSEYYGFSYEECRIAREYYLKAVYSKEPLTNEELQEGKTILQKFYLLLYKNKPKVVQLWYEYNRTIHF